jgi:hypothetical protein
MTTLQPTSDGSPGLARDRLLALVDQILAGNPGGRSAAEIIPENLRWISTIEALILDRLIARSSNDNLRAVAGRRANRLQICRG